MFYVVICLAIHSSASESWLKIKGALGRANGNTLSKKYKPCQSANNSQSLGWTGILRNAEQMSVFAIKEPRASWMIKLIASSSLCIEESSFVWGFCVGQVKNCAPVGRKI